jgi:iron complex outermembrane receptor protein
VNVGLGSAEQTGTVRYGGEARPGLHYRAWGQYRRHDGTTATTPTYDDEWRVGTGGFRMDWMRDATTVTFQGDAFDGSAGTRIAITSLTPPFLTPVDGDADFHGGNLLGRWRRALAGGNAISVQGYYDRTSRTEPHYRETRDTFDIEGQHRFTWGRRQDVVWGVSARNSRGRFDGIPTLRIEPAERTDDIAGLFFQDEVRMMAGRLRVTGGAKAEWNDYTGWHLQPSLRAGFAVHPRHNVWAAVAQAERTTSRVERDILSYVALPAPGAFARVSGSDLFRSETTVSYEAGYKARIARCFIDVAGFHSVYRDLATNETGTPFAEAGTPPEPPRLVIPITIANGQVGSASGAEASATMAVRRGWRLQVAHSFLRVNQTPKPGSNDRNEGFEGNSPRHQFWAASYLTFAADYDVDFVLRRVGEIPGHEVPAFTELDGRLAYRARPGLELALVGQNLLHRRHPEFGGGFEIDRAIRARATVEW